VSDRILSIPIVLGSIRVQRRSERPARLLHERVLAAGHHSELLDLKELGLPIYDEAEASASHPGVQAFRASLAQADAVLWLTPEYNHGYTAATKNAVDYLHRELRRKPVAVCGLSASALGGVRAVEQLKLVLIELHALPIRDSVYFTDARTLYDADGALLRPEFIRRTDEVIAELAWYATALRWAREHVPIPEKRR
jgi:NAD(P)H-dependent FMN reductase